MHRVWHIFELVDNIVQQVALTSLPAVARTSKALHVLAASYIWRSLCSAGQVQCLTEIASSSREGCDRFSMYASFVRRISFDFTFNAANLRKAVQLLFKLCDSPNRFPRLRRLEVSASHAMDVEVAERLLTPTIEDIDVSCRSPGSQSEMASYAFLCILHGNSCSLRKLLLHDTPLTASASLVLVDILSHLPLLSEFKGNSSIITGPVVCALSHLPSLRLLDITFWPTMEEQEAFRESLAKTGPFKSLRILRARTTPRVAAAIVGKVRGQLEQLYVVSHLQVEHTWADFKDLAFSLQGLPASLTTFWLSVHDNDMVVGKPPFVWRDFFPYLRFPALTSFKLNLHSLSCLDICDSDIGALAAAWPSLTDLHIQWGPDRCCPSDVDAFSDADISGLFDDDAITLAGLIPLAVNCPLLRHIQLTSLDAVIPAPTPPVFRSDLRPHHKISLELHEAPLDDAQEVALFLDELWPNIEIECETDYNDEESWTDVQRFLDVLQGSRALRENWDLRATLAREPFHKALQSLRKDY